MVITTSPGWSSLVPGVCASGKSSVGNDVDSRVESLQLFIDRVAVWASRESSWLIDERFVGLREESDAVDDMCADEARALHALLPKDEGSMWAPLVTALKDLGAGVGDDA